MDAEPATTMRLGLIEPRLQTRTAQTVLWCPITHDFCCTVVRLSAMAFMRLQFQHMKMPCCRTESYSPGHSAHAVRANENACYVRLTEHGCLRGACNVYSIGCQDIRLVSRRRKGRRLKYFIKKFHRGLCLGFGRRLCYIVLGGHIPR